MLNHFSEACKCDSYGHFTIKKKIDELRRQQSVPIKIYSTSKIPKKKKTPRSSYCILHSKKH